MYHCAFVFVVVARHVPICVFGLESEADYPNKPYINGTAVCRYNASRVVVKVPKIGDIANGSEKSLEEALHVVLLFCGMLYYDTGLTS